MQGLIVKVIVAQVQFPQAPEVGIRRQVLDASQANAGAFQNERMQLPKMRSAGEDLQPHVTEWVVTQIERS